MTLVIIINYVKNYLIEKEKGGKRRGERNDNLVFLTSIKGFEVEKGCVKMKSRMQYS